MVIRHAAYKMRKEGKPPAVRKQEHDAQHAFPVSEPGPYQYGRRRSAGARDLLNELGWARSFGARVLDIATGSERQHLPGHGLAASRDNQQASASLRDRRPARMFP
jgi:hypothetical protein